MAKTELMYVVVLSCCFITAVADGQTVDRDDTNSYPKVPEITKIQIAQSAKLEKVKPQPAAIDLSKSVDRDPVPTTAPIALARNPEVVTAPDTPVAPVASAPPDRAGARVTQLATLEAQVFAQEARVTAREMQLADREQKLDARQQKLDARELKVDEAMEGSELGRVTSLFDSALVFAGQNLLSVAQGFLSNSIMAAAGTWDAARRESTKNRRNPPKGGGKELDAKAVKGKKKRARDLGDGPMGDEPMDT